MRSPWRKQASTSSPRASAVTKWRSVLTPGAMPTGVLTIAALSGGFARLARCALRGLFIDKLRHRYAYFCEDAEYDSASQNIKCPKTETAAARIYREVTESTMRLEFTDEEQA